MEMTSWPLVFLGVLGPVFPFLFSLMGYRGLVVPRGLDTLSVPQFPSVVGGFLLLVLDVCVGLEEEGVERDW